MLYYQNFIYMYFVESFQFDLHKRSSQWLGGNGFFAIHFRCFSVGQALSADVRRYDGILLRRILAPTLNLREERRSIALVCRIGQDMHGQNDAQVSFERYVVLRMVDSDWPGLEPKSQPQLCQPWTGITVFQRVVSREIQWWTDCWHDALETIQGLVAFQVCCP